MEKLFDYNEFQQLTITDDPDRAFNEHGELRGIREYTTSDTNQEKYYYFQDGIRVNTTHEHYVQYWDEKEASQGGYCGPKVYYSRGGGTGKYYAGESVVIHSEATQADGCRSEGGWTDIECDVTDTCDPVYLDRPVYQDYGFEKERRDARFAKTLAFLNRAQELLKSFGEGRLPYNQWKEKKAIVDTLYTAWMRFNRARYLSQQSCMKSGNWAFVFMTKEQYTQIYAAFEACGIKSKKSK